MGIQEFISREKARGDCYRLLSACFYLPQKDIFLQEDFFKNLTLLLKQISLDASAVSAEMEKAFLKCSNEDLTVDYAKLFVGPNELAAPPYGSVYLDGERRVMGDSTMEVIKMYQESGLSIDEEFKELPDHITVELEFMYYLIFKEVEALEKSDLDTALHFYKMQEIFLNSFLGRWIIPFCERIKEGTENEFYRSLADCVYVFIKNSHPGDDIPEELRVKTVHG